MPQSCAPRGPGRRCRPRTGKCPLAGPGDLLVAPGGLLQCHVSRPLTADRATNPARYEVVTQVRQGPQRRRARLREQDGAAGMGHEASQRSVTTPRVQRRPSAAGEDRRRCRYLQSRRRGRRPAGQFAPVGPTRTPNERRSLSRVGQVQCRVNLFCCLLGLSSRHLGHARMVVKQGPTRRLITTSTGRR